MQTEKAPYKYRVKGAENGGREANERGEDQKGSSKEGKEKEEAKEGGEK